MSKSYSYWLIFGLTFKASMLTFFILETLGKGLFSISEDGTYCLYRLTAESLSWLILLSNLIESLRY
jgi:hypothetical protein